MKGWNKKHFLWSLSFPRYQSRPHFIQRNKDQLHFMLQPEREKNILLNLKSPSHKIIACKPVFGQYVLLMYKPWYFWTSLPLHKFGGWKLGNPRCHKLMVRKLQESYFPFGHFAGWTRYQMQKFHKISNIFNMDSMFITKINVFFFNLHNNPGCCR